jgi:hypothetical protein
MMHNRTWRQNPQHAPFQVALATMNARRSSRDNLYAERAGMKIQPMVSIRATNGLSLVLIFARTGSANSGGDYGYPRDTQEDKNGVRYAMQSASTLLVVLLPYSRTLRNERYCTLRDKVWLEIMSVADDGGRHGY